MLPSTRNSADGQRSLFTAVNCLLLLHSEGVDTHVGVVKSALPEVRSFQIPDFDGLFKRGCQPCRLERCQNRRAEDQVIVLHTSGSTGHPKPIFHTSASIWTLAALATLPSTRGRQNIMDAFLQSGATLLAVAPFFHIMGQVVLWRSLICRAPLVILSPTRPPDPELIVKAIEQVGPSLAMFPPSLLESVANTPGGLDTIRLLNVVIFAGGPLATGVGEKLISCTNLLNMLGSTEAGIYPSLVPLSKHDWQYFEWIPSSGMTMKVDSSGLHELVIVKTSKNRRYQAVFQTFPEVRDWSTGDLFERHPGNMDLWLYRGRKDDLLVLSNGEKFHPVGFEKLVESHPMVKGALVVGEGRFQTGLLVELDWVAVPPSQKSSEILSLVWPLIDKANALAPAYGKVWRSMIATASRDKPFKRTPKGSIVRRQTVDLYEAEIHALYGQLSAYCGIDRLPCDANITTIKNFIHRFLKLNDLEVPDSSSDDFDIFCTGVDSLQILALASTMNHTIGDKKGVAISPQDIYRHPMVNGLAEFLYSGMADPARNG